MFPILLTVRKCYHVKVWLAVSTILIFNHSTAYCFFRAVETPITDCWHDNGIPILLVNPLPLKTPTRYGSQRLSIRFWWTTARFLLGWSPYDIPLIHHMDLSENRVGPILQYPSVSKYSFLEEPISLLSLLVLHPCYIPTYIPLYSHDIHDISTYPLAISHSYNKQVNNL